MRRTADLLGADPYPGSTPQFEEDHKEPGNALSDLALSLEEPQTTEYRWIYAHGQLHVSPVHDHEQLRDRAGIQPDHAGPFAAGYVHLQGKLATWSAESNVALRGLSKVLEDYGDTVGWEWGGLVGGDGQPIADELGAKKSMWYREASNGEVNLAMAPFSGATEIEIRGKKAYVDQTENPALMEWAKDFGLSLCARERDDTNWRLAQVPPVPVKEVVTWNYPAVETAGHTPTLFDRDTGILHVGPQGTHHFELHNRIDNPEGEFEGGYRDPDAYDHDHPDTPEQGQLIADALGLPLKEHKPFFGRTAEYPGGGNAMDKMKEWETLDGHDKGNPEAEPRPTDFGEIEGPIECPDCGKMCNNFMELQLHAQDHEGLKPEPRPDGHFPWPEDKDAPLPLRNRNVNPTAQPVMGSWHFTAEEPKDMVQASIPFIYDVMKDHITTGHPGMKSGDIMGQFTPAGIVEGTYEPGGKVIINSTTNMPYSVYHMLQLWYYQHPTMEITSLEMETGDGSTTKLAGASVGSYLKQLTATEPAAWNAYQALRKAGGKVYVVGGAVRDALLQKDPKDIDLMVAGIPPEEVNHILSNLPGRVDLTGKKFGVYRYKHNGGEVEVALPREDSYEEGAKRSEGQIRVDHNMPIEDDLLRRDFTANSMAVDLDDGKLIDPYGGAKDISANALRTTHPSSFKEDPTRLLRALVANSRFGLAPDEKTRQEMADNASRLADESPDALKPILVKLLESANPARAIRLAQDTGLLHHVFPELANNFDYDQRNPHHNYTLGEHSLHVLDNVSRTSADPDVRLAALLHDIGKPASAWTDENGINHYYEGRKDGEPVGADHAKVGAEMAEARLRKGFNYPVASLNRVRQLIDGHMFPAFSSPKSARKFLNKYGQNADDLLTLREGDLAGKGTGVEADEASQQVEGMRNLVGQVRTQGEATDKSSLLVNGNDLITDLGMKPGPEIGEALSFLMENVVEYPQLNNRTDLINLARNWYENHSPRNQ